MESQSPAVRSVKEDDEPAIRSSSCRKHESSLETETHYYCSPAVLLLVACVCVCVCLVLSDRRDDEGGLLSQTQVSLFSQIKHKGIDSILTYS